MSRTAFKDNSSYYQLNGKKVPFKEVAVLLRESGIDLDHNRFLILQVNMCNVFMCKCLLYPCTLFTHLPCVKVIEGNLPVDYHYRELYTGMLKQTYFSANSPTQTDCCHFVMCLYACLCTVYCD